MRMVLLGAPGSGKGTQCGKITGRYAVKHLSSGDILRRQRKLKTQLAQKAASYMDSGELVPDDIIVRIMAAAIRETSDGGFVLDGFPRTIDQAAELDRILEDADGGIEIVLNLKVDDDTVMRRLTGRRVCPECGAVYHVRTLQPKTAGRCDRDGAELVQRTDDKPEVVANRLQAYHRQTKPLVQYYRQKGILHEMDAGREIEEVTKAVFAVLDGFYAGRDDKAVCRCEQRGSQ